MDKKVINAFLDGSTQGIPEFRTDLPRTIIAESAPVSISDLIQIPGLCHGTGVWEGNGQALVKSGMPIGRLIAYQDDVFHYIQEKMKLESSSGTGYACGNQTTASGARHTGMAYRVFGKDSVFVSESLQKNSPQGNLTLPLRIHFA